MHVARKRIFVDNLPPHVQENDIEEVFGQYGNVVSVEIHYRKDAPKKETSNVFAFVSIETDDYKLEECFHEVAIYDWQGYFVKLKHARESFLEKLKREREEAQGKTPVAPTNIVEKLLPVAKQTKAPIVKPNPKDDSDSEEETSTITKTVKTQIKLVPDLYGDTKFVPVNNKNKVINGKLQIASVTATPTNLNAPKIETAEPKDAKSLAADEKRKKSLMQMKQTYNQQKSAIKNALSSIDQLPKNKIIFGNQPNSNKHNASEELYNNNSKKHKVDLFENDENDEEDFNFEVKKQFEGEKGQQLLELQTRFTNDRRFTLDSRFLDEDPDQYPAEDEHDERDQQYDILESVLGKRIKKFSKTDRDRNIPQPMLRFDPSKPEHSKFVLKRAEKSKSKLQHKYTQEFEPKIEEATVEVSKETFYKVRDNLKESLQENKGFSLLNTYGRTEEKDEDIEEQQSEKLRPKQFGHGRNPFKYDSSDTEDDGEAPNKTQVAKKSVDVISSWRETFFFASEDKRLQDGLEFLKKLGCEVKESFPKMRRELKQIIRSKVRNNQRNNRPFKHKLGRNKMIKVREAKKQ